MVKAITQLSSGDPVLLTPVMAYTDPFPDTFCIYRILGLKWESNGQPVDLFLTMRCGQVEKCSIIYSIPHFTNSGSIEYMVKRELTCYTHINTSR